MTRQRRALAAVIAVTFASAAFAARATPSGPPAIVVHRVDEAGFGPVRDAPFFVLVVGHDGREGVEGRRGDALHVIGVNPAEGRATILNIPRDTWTNIPGHGTEKITMAYWFGGAQLQVKAVAGLTGVPISFVVTTDFAGFQTMVDEVGGIDVDVPFAMDEPLSGAVLPQGPAHLDGRLALAFARNRHVPNGDLVRTGHQGLLLLAALAKARAEATGPVETLRLLGVVARNTEVEGVAFDELYRLARLAVSIDPANVRNVTLPSRLGEIGAAQVVFTAPEARALLADFRDDAVLQSF